MTPLETMKAKLTELRSEANGLIAQRGALLDAAITRGTALTDDEKTRKGSFDAVLADIEANIPNVEQRIAELAEAETRAAAHAAVRVDSGESVERSGTQVTDAPIYAEGKADTSYFRDMFEATKGSTAALDRLARNHAMVQDQTRALGNTGAAGGSGGEFAPPLWLINEFVGLARPGRKFADSLNPKTLPEGISSVNLPRVATGTTTAIQTTQNSALSATDMTTNSVSSGIVTIGGTQVVALQLLKQSGIPFDEVILQDLAADYARQFSVQTIAGSNASGQLNGVLTYFTASGTANVTYTQATPAVGGAGGLYSKIFAAAAAIETARFLPPDTIWMHPRRWNWILSSSDTQNRPLVNPSATAMNVVATANGVGSAQGIVGSIGSLDVITDASIPTNTGVGTNQDPVLVGVRSDLRLWESALRVETFEQPFAQSAGVLFRVLAFAAAIPQRYTTSVAVVNGTGLVTPAF